MTVYTDISLGFLWHFIRILWHLTRCVFRVVMPAIYPQPVRRHYHPKYTLITLAPVSYLRSLVVRAVHRHRTGVGSIPAGGPIVDEFFSTVPD